MAIVGWKTRAMFDRYNIIDERDVHVAGARMDSYNAELDEKVRTKVRTEQDNADDGADQKELLIQ